MLVSLVAGRVVANLQDMFDFNDDRVGPPLWTINSRRAVWFAVLLFFAAGLGMGYAFNKTADSDVSRPPIPI